MARTCIEETNGSFRLVVPREAAVALDLHDGAEFDVTIRRQSLVLTPAKRKWATHRLADLIAATDPRSLARTDEDTEWLESSAAGRELL